MIYILLSLLIIAVVQGKHFHAHDRVPIVANTGMSILMLINSNNYLLTLLIQ